MLKVTIFDNGYPQHTFTCEALPPVGRSWQLTAFGTMYYPYPPSKDFTQVMGGRGVKKTDEGRWIGTFTWEAIEIK